MTDHQRTGDKAMLYRFLTYMNATSSGTTYANIAYYISNNFTKVVHMNLEELADACYVSQATISRFCRFLGFDSFTHFKMACHESLRDGERRINEIVSTMSQNDEEYMKAFQIYGKTVIDEMQSFVDSMNLEELDRLLERIHDTEDVALFGVHRCASCIQEVQFSFALKDKFVKAYSGSAQQVECARSLKKESLAIVFEAHDGFWFEEQELVNVLMKSSCYKILVTAGGGSERTDMFDEIYRVGSGRARGCAYAMMNFNEAMISRYFTKF